MHLVSSHTGKIHFKWITIDRARFQILHSMWWAFRLTSFQIETLFPWYNVHRKSTTLQFRDILFRRLMGNMSLLHSMVCLKVMLCLWKSLPCEHNQNHSMSLHEQHITFIYDCDAQHNGDGCPIISWNSLDLWPWQPSMEFSPRLSSGPAAQSPLILHWL